MCPVLYYTHVQTESHLQNIDFTKPVLSLEVTCKGGNHQTDILTKTLKKLDLRQIRKLDIKIGDKTNIGNYIEIRNMLMAGIDTTYLEDLSLDFCFLKTSHRTDQILERFSTNWLFPSINSLTIRFFENVRQDWCDHNSNKLKLYLHGIFQTNIIKTINLVNLDNDLFHSIHSFLHEISVDDGRHGNKMMKSKSHRNLTFNFEKAQVTTDFVINLD